ncbi:MAG: VOC family protein, partial [Alphaproteobacteria bacterium]|nr:VOC family protein [Alphaproteobacteria bacterium]
ARAAWTRLGFALSPRGRHVGWGTANYTVMFEADYIALLGIVDASQFVNYVDEALAWGDGITNLAFRTADAEALQTMLTGRGIPAATPHVLQRLIEFSEGKQALDFRLVELPRRWTPGLHSFAFHHLTPSLLRRPEWLAHPNGARGIAEVTVVMEDLDGVVAAYRTLFGEDAVSGEERRGSVTVETGNGELWFVTPKMYPAHHYNREIAAGTPLPRFAALTLRVADPRATSLYLSGQEVSYEVEANGTVVVPPESANGVLLEFAADGG